MCDQHALLKWAGLGPRSNLEFLPRYEIKKPLLRIKFEIDQKNFFAFRIEINHLLLIISYQIEARVVGCYHHPEIKFNPIGNRDLKYMQP